MKLSRLAFIYAATPVVGVGALEFIKQFDFITGSRLDDNFKDAYEFSDGSLLLSGTTKADGTENAYLVRLDPFGNILWNRTHTYNDTQLALNERGGSIT